jgi:predicted TIM-barrel fold metal-dependent hydrolase
MLDEAVAALGSQRLLWGSDVTMETGLAKLRALENTGLSSADDVQDIRWRNAARVFGLRPQTAQSTQPRARSAKRAAS